MFLVDFLHKKSNLKRSWCPLAVFRCWSYDTYIVVLVSCGGLLSIVTGISLIKNDIYRSDSISFKCCAPNSSED